VISWQVLEHVPSLSAAFTNSYAYLKPGGLFVSHFSGKWALFALVNQLVPHRVAKAMVKYLMGRSSDAIFPAPYDKCWATAVERLLRTWDDVCVMPYYFGATYLRKIPPAQVAYLLGENIIAHRNLRNLATHYTISARKPESVLAGVRDAAYEAA
jgi:hypothetical protein